MNSPAPSKKTPETGEKKDAIELLKADHREVEQLFSQFESAKGRQQRRKLVEKIAAALTAHTIIEEEIFYPACREQDVEEDDLDEAQVEHDAVKILVSDLIKGSQDDDYYEAKVTVLSEYVKHHVGEEEKAGDGIFARAKSAGVDLVELGQEMQSRKDELMADQKRLLSRPPEIRSLDLFQQSRDHGDRARHPDESRHRDEERDEYYSRDYDDYRRAAGARDRAPSPEYRGDYGDRERRPPSRGIENSASGGRYRTYYGDDGDYDRPGSGRYLGPGGEDREYYHRTRYGSGSYRSEDDQDYGPGRYRG